MKPHHCLVFDPIAFKGGSKIATREILALCQRDKVRFTIITRDPDSWQTKMSDGPEIRFIRLPSLGKLSTASRGLAFWLKHGLYCLFLLRIRLMNGPIDMLLGASGPGVDMSLYLLKRILKYRMIQLIHGPVGYSRSIGRCLLDADQVFFLNSARESMVQAIAFYFMSHNNIDKSRQLAHQVIARANFQSFINGLSRSQWPSPCQYNKPTLFWCASLLKWKGLDLLLNALSHIPDPQPYYSAHICFIRPKNSTLEVSSAPQSIKQVYWFHDPKNLDQIRSQSNIFVSTSQNEPFGLSILEAIAAEMCVIIPKDNAYWDTILTDQVHCLKYRPNDPDSLQETILQAIHRPGLVQRLGQSAARLAKHYQAENCYQPIAACIHSPASARDPEPIVTGEKL